MNAELAEIRDFLTSYPPFSLINGEAIDALPGLFAIRYLRRGSVFPPEAEKTPCLYVIRKGAVEIRTSGGGLVDKLAEGDLFDATQTGVDDGLSGMAIEDSLLYLLSAEKLQGLRQNSTELDQYFVRDAAEQLRHGRRDLASYASNQSSLMTMAVEDFIQRSPVCAPPSFSICEAARQMSDERVSALLVVAENMLCGILTDRDLRSRCLAKGLSADSPISEIMSKEVASIGPKAVLSKP